MKMKAKRAAAPESAAPVGTMRCIYLNLDSRNIDFDLAGLEVHPAKTVNDVFRLIEANPSAGWCVVLGLSRNLMDNYLAIASLFFRRQPGEIPIIPVTHAGNKIAEHKAFLFGKKPYPFKRLDLAKLQQLVEIRTYSPRHFIRIPVEFVAFAQPEGSVAQYPVVCRNISWSGTYFETRENMDFDRFTLILRSRIHTVELPSRIVRRVNLAKASPPRYGFGVEFLMPLPLSLIHYMYAKHMKDQH